MLSLWLKIIDISIINIIKNIGLNNDPRGAPYIMYRSDDKVLLFLL